MSTRSLEIKTSAGLTLSAKLDRPDGEVLATALFAHCFTCGKDILAASRISKRLVSQGIAVLRFDFTGLGASSGEFADTNFSSNIADLVDAAEWLRINYKTPSLIIGHSLGGTAILAAADRLPYAKAFVTIGSPSDPRHILNLIGAQSLEEIAEAGSAVVTLEGRPFRIKKQFVEDASEQRVLNQVRTLKRPLLIMHSPIDRTVDIEHATALFHAAAHPKSFMSLGDADHLISKREDADFIADVIASWSARYTRNDETNSQETLMNSSLPLPGKQAL
ncbi:MAG TPA: alpha/beta hydrolase [Methylophilaceae bacterium]|nr:alpha/beta hydrolase [Methylophilaceae bacterium]